MRNDEILERGSAEAGTIDNRSALEKKPYEEPTVIFVPIENNWNLEIPECPYE